MFKHILVPTDGSDLSSSTVARAIEFAKEAGARITFFFAQQEYPIPLYGEGALLIPIAPDQFVEATKRESERILAEARQAAESAGVTADCDTTVSDLPYEAIIEAAKRHQCDLIFMASHGRKGVAGFLLGSETQKVLTHTTVPVLVYR
ncbi:universal stress protein [Niveibacterium sp. 24ML]|uniref:universal stress protein n=1 Tax=Niveibacterium sp. 24ML TaxID=2985512 RepID=UPI00226EC5B8|nr:universal stress protein [Niveibacterium sp. 24ML]MCX9157038.1 universal stress protein [Niveibacterium sp. 24ML]